MFAHDCSEEFLVSVDMTMKIRGEEAGRQACVLYIQRVCFDTL